MLNKKELISILSVTVVLGIIISLIESWEIFGWVLLSVFGVILINTIAKKITAHYLATDVEIKTWEWKRYGYKKHQKLKSALPFGILVPLILKFLSVGLLNWMACLTFEVKGKIYKAAKKHGIYSFSEVTEKEMGWIASAGIWANLVFAVVGYLTGATIFANISIAYAFYNIIPISNLDGTKIFFGSIPNWAFLGIVSTIGFLASIIIV